MDLYIVKSHIEDHKKTKQMVLLKYLCNALNLKWRPKTYMGPQGRITAAKPFDFELSENHSCRFCLFAKRRTPRGLLYIVWNKKNNTK